MHDSQNDYPLAPEKLEITQNMLSKCCSDTANEYGVKIGGVNKLVPNLHNKSKHVVHYRNLQLYLSLEMKLTKVHRVLKVKQSDWLKKTLILIPRNGKMRLIILRKIFLNWPIIAFLGKQWKICVKEEILN